MTGICINLFTDIEEELGKGTETISNLRKRGKQLHERFNKIADVLEALEKSDWNWTTGCKDIYAYKDISVEKAKQELEKLKIDQSLYHIEAI